MEAKLQPPRVLLECNGFDPYTPELHWMKREAEDWLNAASPRWLSLLGSSGVGKTMIASALAKQRNATFRKWTWVLDLLRQREWGVKDFLIRRPVLVIDDLGSAHETPFAQAFMEELADRRLGSWTVWTSNLLLHQIGEHVSQRVRSRMRRGGSRVVEIVSTKDWNDKDDQ